MIRNVWIATVVAVIALITTVNALRTAVIIEDARIQQTHSKFFKLLEARGHELSFFENDPKLTLEEYGVRSYDNLVIFSPQKKLGISKADLLNFIENGGNILLSSSTKLTKLQREFALECGVEYEKKGNLVIDHIKPIATEEDIYNTVIGATDFVASERVVGKVLADTKSKLPKKPVAFSGMGLSLEPNNILGFHVLVAPTTAYSANPVKEITQKIVENDLLFGNQIGLVTAIQARNNARLVFSGSLDLFSNKYFTNKFSNEEFSDAITKWVFQESGVLRMQNIEHKRADGRRPDKMLKDTPRPDQPITLYPDAEIARDSLVYRIKDNLTFSFDLHELVNGEYVPYKASDVQLEFVMLDPYVRKTMSHNNKGRFSVTIEAPDQYGIYLFRVMYRRLGLSTIYSTTQVSVRPFKHDEYERFIPAAYPYYISAFSMMTGVFIFSIFFLFHEEKKK